MAGIDPNIEMLHAASPSPGTTLLAGRAESLPFRDGVACLLTVFNAFHWFQPQAFFEEAHRVLAPQGQLALVWNDCDANDAFNGCPGPMRAARLQGVQSA